MRIGADRMRRRDRGWDRHRVGDDDSDVDSEDECLEKIREKVLERGGGGGGGWRRGWEREAEERDRLSRRTRGWQWAAVTVASAPTARPASHPRFRPFSYV